MPFQSGQSRSDCFKAQQPFFNPAVEAEADRFHIAADLALRLFKSEIEGLLSAAAGGIYEIGRQSRFSCSCCPRDQDGASAEKSISIEHFVEPRHARRNVRWKWIFLRK